MSKNEKEKTRRNNITFIMFIQFNGKGKLNYTVNPALQPPGVLFFNLSPEGGTIKGRGTNTGRGTIFQPIFFEWLQQILNFSLKIKSFI
jgi:hypothetical protein